MKPIDKNELYQNLRGFLKSKGIELDDGSITKRIRQGRALLTEAVNATRKTVKRAQVEVDNKLDHLRQSIHEATMPKAPSASRAAEPRPTGKPGRRKGKAPAHARGRRRHKS